MQGEGEVCKGVEVHDGRTVSMSCVLLLLSIILERRRCEVKVEIPFRDTLKAGTLEMEAWHY